MTFDAKEPLSHVDHAWLRMDDPTNLMMINGVIVFDEPVGVDDVKTVVRERLLPIRRFRQRVAIPGGRHRPHWEAVEELDLDQHVSRVVLPEPGDDRALRTMVSRLMSTPLDRRHPLWHFHLIENYRGTSALMGRLHHCIGDGIALTLVLLSMTELTPAAATVGAAAEEGSPTAPPNPFTTLFCQPQEGFQAARELAEQVMPEGMKLLMRPVEALRATRTWKKGAAAVGALSRLTFRSPDPSTAFKGALGVEKRAAWSDPIPMEEVKAVEQALGGTVNDVLLTAITGALRNYLQGRGELAQGLNFRAAIPVNLRPLEEMCHLGNRFGLVFLSLPVGIADPRERLTELRRRMRALKRSAEPLVAFGILKALGRSSVSLQRTALKLFGAKATAVMTNVPGPRETLYFAGKPIREIFFWVPQAGRLGLGISFLSYAGRVQVGVGTDAGLVPDPESIVDGFHDEFEQMQRLAQDLRR